MPLGRHRRMLSCLALADGFIRAVRKTRTPAELHNLLEAVTRDMECRWFALIHHDDLRLPRPDRVDLKDYPAAATERIINQRHSRRDPIIRGRRPEEHTLKPQSLMRTPYDTFCLKKYTNQSRTYKY